jgi:tetratricopeptide (TPR) repeat protein
MTVPGLDEGLSPEKQAVVTKKELIDSLAVSLKQNEIDKAADLYRRCNEDVGYELMSLAAGGPLAKPLASVFLEAKDYYKAAQIFDSLDLTKEAAENFEKAGAFELAADMYGRLGDIASSAEMFERGGSYSRAAPFFAQAGRWLDAGRNYEKAEEAFLAGQAFGKGGDKKKALECLQKVQTNDPSYVQSVALLGPLLEEMGFSELALQKYQEVTQDGSIAYENIEAFYSLAKAYESSGQREKAKEIYVKILEKDLGYKDVQQRYAALKEPSGAAVGEEPSAPPQTATPASDQRAEPAKVVVLDEDNSHLEKNVLLNGLTFDEIRDVLGLADKITYKAGDIIFREGDELPGLGLIQKGQVDVGMRMESKDIRIARFGPGEHFGEMTVLGPHKARVTVVAAAEGSYILIRREQIQAVLERNADLKAKFMRNVLMALDEHLLGAKEIIKAAWSRGKPASKG